MSDIPKDYAHKRGVWALMRPSAALRYIEGDEGYARAIRQWEAAEPYAEIAKQLAALTLDTLHADLIRDQAFFEGTQWLPDEAKVAATAQIACTLPPATCPRCAKVFYTAVCGCSTALEAAWSSKPATPEPPEWVTVKSTATWKNGHIGPVDVQITPDPIAEFNERRKAKREEYDDDAREEYLQRLVNEALDGQDRSTKRAAPLARAMSTPLPHDPPISVRLMPWRGKE